MCGADELIAEQHSDAGLADCWQQAKASKGDFMISRGVLYHEDEVKGVPDCQLCASQSERVHELAHTLYLIITLGCVRLPTGVSCYFAGMECARVCTAVLGRALRGDYSPGRRRATRVQRAGGGC